ncbi:flagellar hook-length control protein FliK [Candidatus Sumerlaeota bacterium]|nr:flagellar hook-length control protein FliK [Candidatus Sumerlaeota bacterium]
MIRFQSRSIPPFPFLPMEKTAEQSGSSMFAGMVQFLNGQLTDPVPGPEAEAGANTAMGQMPLLDVSLDQAGAGGAEEAAEVLEALSDLLDPSESEGEGEIDPTGSPDGLAAMLAAEQPDAVKEHLASPASRAGLPGDSRGSRNLRAVTVMGASEQTSPAAEGKGPGEKSALAASLTEAESNTTLSIEQMIARQNAKAADSQVADLRALPRMPGAQGAGGAEQSPTALSDQPVSPLTEPIPKTPESTPLHLEFSRAPIAGTSPQSSHSTATDASKPQASPEGSEQSSVDQVTLGGQWQTSTRHGIGSVEMNSRDQTAVTRVIRQVTGPVHIAMASQGDTKTVTVHLTPPDLGRIEISVEGPEEHTGRVEVMIRGDRPDTERLLTLHLPALREALESQGINLGDLTLNFAGHGQHAEGEGDSSGSQGFAAGQAIAEEEVIAESVPLPVQRIAAGHRISVVA